MLDEIAVLIPCYNESKSIAKVIQDMKRELPEATIREAHPALPERTAKATGKKAAPLIATAATVALLVGATLWAMPHWQRPASVPEDEEIYMAATLATESTGETTAPVPIEYPVLEDWARGILDNTRAFENKTDGEELNLEEYLRHYQTLTKEKNCRYSMFAWQDLDGDGQTELAVSFSRKGSLELTLVLGRREEKIISQEIWGGGMQFLQRDDSYLSFNTFTWHRLEWAADGWTVRDLPDHPSVWDMERDTSEWYDVGDYLSAQEN